MKEIRGKDKDVNAKYNKLNLLGLLIDLALLGYALVNI